ncbi:uncharacterized protein LOC105205586 [Solenopsis invicta]|uniref:uncharacterized protein LOC105205586 n=1 Tax=Solenopsis invicta TaxID=13686 RepID=UPI0005959BE3|nr:uncharacterized protein LOC105205586 [Solenopsis invicta]
MACAIGSVFGNKRAREIVCKEKLRCEGFREEQQRLLVGVGQCDRGEGVRKQVENSRESCVTAADLGDGLKKEGDTTENDRYRFREAFDSHPIFIQISLSRAHESEIKKDAGIVRLFSISYRNQWGNKLARVPVTFEDRSF